MKFIIVQLYNDNDNAINDFILSIADKCVCVHDKCKLRSARDWKECRIDNPDDLRAEVNTLSKDFDTVITVCEQFNFIFKFVKCLEKANYGRHNNIIDEPIEIITHEDDVLFDSANITKYDVNNDADLVSAFIGVLRKYYSEVDINSLPINVSLKIMRHSLGLVQEDIELLSNGAFRAGTISTIETGVIPIDSKYTAFMRDLYNKYKDNPSDIKKMADDKENLYIRELRAVTGLQLNEVSSTLGISDASASRIERGCSNGAYYDYKKFLEESSKKMTEYQIRESIVSVLNQQKVTITAMYDLISKRDDFSDVFKKKESMYSWVKTLTGESPIGFNHDQYLIILDVVSKFSLDKSDPEVAHRISYFNSKRNPINYENMKTKSNVETEIRKRPSQPDDEIEDDDDTSCVKQEHNIEVENQPINENNEISEQSEPKSLQDMLNAGMKVWCPALASNEYLRLIKGKIVKCIVKVEVDDTQLPLDLILRSDWVEKK